MIESRRLLCLVFRMPLAALFMLSALSSAFASGESCDADWGIKFTTKFQCDNIAALAPSNDTRVNLLLLLGGLPPKSPKPIDNPVLEWGSFRDLYAPRKAPGATDFAVGEGSRCRSNADGETAFDAALKSASDLAPDERDILLAARDALKPDCSGGNATKASIDATVERLQSKSGKAFATYLRGAASFYQGQFDDAVTAFATVKTSADPWLAESGDYMVARTLVNRLQQGAFDTYGEFNGSGGVDQEVATRAEDSLVGYLKDHPHGLYASSARGLLRRVDWLSGRTEKLAARYAAVLAKPAAERGIDDVALAQEIDSKLLPNLKPMMTKDPILLAIVDLEGMRRQPERSGAPLVNAIGKADLEAQHGAFASMPELYDFLLAAAAFTLDGESAAVIKSLPDATRRRDGDALWFSRQLLRGEALEAAGDRNTRWFWKELHAATEDPLARSTVELALALHEERHGELDAVFAAGSLVTNTSMRNILLSNIAGPALLRSQARDPAASRVDRDNASQTLLFKELTRGRYADFLADLEPMASDLPPTPDPNAGKSLLRALVQGEGPGEIGCPKLPLTASHLARDPLSVRDRLCLAEFVRVNSFDGNPFETHPAKSELGGTPTLFPGVPYVRAATYQAIIADRGAPPADRAYALYRAVKCYEPSGVNDCSGPDLPKAERKAWYDALKRDYPNSRWAKSLHYWW